MEAKVKGLTPPDPVSPEGIDCSAWFDQLNAMAFWDRIDLIASEYTMTDERKSLGGQLDLLCVFKEKVLLIDLKTKSASWKGPSRDDIESYKAQAGGYLMLLQSGDDHHGGCWVDSCPGPLSLPLPRRNGSARWIRTIVRSPGTNAGIVTQPI